jgi:hypothetical protein
MFTHKISKKKKPKQLLLSHDIGILKYFPNFRRLFLPVGGGDGKQFLQHPTTETDSQNHP